MARGAAEHLAEHSQLEALIGPGSELQFRQGGNSLWRYPSSATPQQDLKGSSTLSTGSGWTLVSNPKSHIHVLVLHTPSPGATLSQDGWQQMLVSEDLRKERAG